MIRKCNTSHSKANSTPYNNIKVSNFEDNEDEFINSYPLEEIDPNCELNFNIVKIIECKRQTQEAMIDMHNRIKEQNIFLQQQAKQNQRVKQKAQFYRLKYQQTLLENRKKEEEKDALQRKLTTTQQRYELMMENQRKTREEWLAREKHYRHRIQELERMNNASFNSHFFAIIGNMDEGQKQCQSTFI